MYFKVHVTPEAKRPGVVATSSGAFKVSVKEKAEHNLANQRALASLAKHLNVNPKALRIVSGHRSPHKIIHLFK